MIPVGIQTKPHTARQVEQIIHEWKTESTWLGERPPIE